jgi:DNA-binding MarR family transcriptional regulator
MTIYSLYRFILKFEGKLEKFIIESPVDWFELHPLDLIQRSSVEEAQRALDAIDALSPAQASVLDAVLESWALTALMRLDDRESALELHSLVNDSRQFLASATNDATELLNFDVRWKAFSDLLEGKNQALLSRSNAPTLGREEEIFQALAGGVLTQKDLAEKLKLSAGRMSQLLTVLEGRGKVLRRKSGREVMVSVSVSSNIITTAELNNVPPPTSLVPQTAAIDRSAPQESGDLLKRIFGKGQAA